MDEFDNYDGGSRCSDVSGDHGCDSDHSDSGESNGNGGKIITVYGKNCYHMIDEDSPGGYKYWEKHVEGPRKYLTIVDEDRNEKAKKDITASIEGIYECWYENMWQDRTVFTDSSVESLFAGNVLQAIFEVFEDYHNPHPFFNYDLDDWAQRGYVDWDRLETYGVNEKESYAFSLVLDELEQRLEKIKNGFKVEWKLDAKAKAQVAELGAYLEQSVEEDAADKNNKKNRRKRIRKRHKVSFSDICGEEIHQADECGNMVASKEICDKKREEISSSPRSGSEEYAATEGEIDSSSSKSSRAGVYTINGNVVPTLNGRLPVNDIDTPIKFQKTTRVGISSELDTLQHDMNAEQAPSSQSMSLSLSSLSISVQTHTTLPNDDRQSSPPAYPSQQASPSSSLSILATPFFPSNYSPRTPLSPSPPLAIHHTRILRSARTITSPPGYGNMCLRSSKTL